MTNAQIAAVFDEVADLLEFQGANPFRVRAYRNGARTIGDLPESITSLVAGEQPLTELPGIGKDLAEKCVVLIETSELPMLSELRQEVPSGVLDMLRIAGLGPKKAAVLHKELGIVTLDQLKAACQEGKVRELKGFGEKTEKTILEGIGFAAQAGQRIYWARADEIAQTLLAHLRECPAVEAAEMAGSYRRGCETVGDLDVLVDSSDPVAVMDHFGRFDDASETMLRGDTKMSIRLASGLQVDLRVVPKKSYGAALQYFTGSKDHNIVLRGLAKDRDLKINEYGLFRLRDDKETYLAGAGEEEIYAALDLPLFPPELREARREFEWAAEGELPELIELGDLRGDLHMHTTATDGTASIEKMVAAARKLGHKYLAITDHSQRVTMAGGLDGPRLRRQWKKIDQINEKLSGKFTVLKGIECDILEKGGMDLPDDVLSEADWVVASIHYGQNQPESQITDRIVGALEHPSVSAIAHPTGRLLNRRKAYAVDLEAVFAAAAENGKLLELNSNPARLDLNDVYCAAAKARGVRLVISSDAHSTEGLQVLRYGILQARRAGLTRSDVANTRTLKQFRRLLDRN